MDFNLVFVVIFGLAAVTPLGRVIKGLAATPRKPVGMHLFQVFVAICFIVWVVAEHRAPLLAVLAKWTGFAAVFTVAIIKRNGSAKTGETAGE